VHVDGDLDQVTFLLYALIVLFHVVEVGVYPPPRQPMSSGMRERLWR
jgi:hypothetical protein